MHNYISSNDDCRRSPPTLVATPSSTAAERPLRHGQNFSQHARLLPYMEQTPVYNAINFPLRGAGGGPRPQRPSTRARRHSAIQRPRRSPRRSPRSSARPTPPRPAAQQPVIGGQQAVSPGNYPQHRPESPATTTGAQRPDLHRPDWDGAFNGDLELDSFVDGTSNTAIFSEWVKGPAQSTGPARTGSARSITSTGPSTTCPRTP